VLTYSRVETGAHDVSFLLSFAFDDGGIVARLTKGTHFLPFKTATTLDKLAIMHG
jgi:hypothetical protein